jgi:hypothetical protein
MLDVEMRLEKLERGMQRWRLVAIALAIGLIGFTFLGAAPGDVADVLRCRQLEVINAKGAVVARLENLPKPLGGDGGWLTCFSTDGKPKLRMGAQVGGDAQFNVMSGAEASDSCVTISASPEGGGQITLNGPNQAPYVLLAAPPGQAGKITVSTKTGKTMWHAGP